MIVSHAHKYIFIKTVKTAGTSLEICLSKYCGDNDIITPLIDDEEILRKKHGGLSGRNYLKPISELGSRQKLRALLTGKRPAKFIEHHPGWQIKRAVPKDVWDNYFKFTIVRDPFDRNISRFYFTKKWDEERGKLKPYNESNPDQYFRYRQALVNENWVLYTKNDEVLVDYTIKFESLFEDIAFVGERVGLGHRLAEEFAGVRAKGEYRPKDTTPTILSSDHRKLIFLMCKKEIELYYPKYLEEFSNM